MRSALTATERSRTQKRNLLLAQSMPDKTKEDVSDPAAYTLPHGTDPPPPAHLDLLMVRFSFFSICFMRPIAAVYLSAVSRCSSSFLVLLCSASITCGSQSQVSVSTGPYSRRPPRPPSSPSGWRGSASPARLRQTAGCPPPGVSAQPARWSPWPLAAPRWLSGSPAWPSGPPAGPEHNRDQSIIINQPGWRRKDQRRF